MIPQRSAFLCPVCKAPLFRLSGGLKCFGGHCFDIAREGYVNLLLKNAAGKRHGDDTLMVKARRHFLGRGYYSPLRQAVAEVVGEGNILLDMGCGEGYYTSLLAEKNTVRGIDISKAALRSAAGLCPAAELAVASIADIPLPDGILDVAVSIFAPDPGAEADRLLKKGGRLIMVFPNEEHLFGLKAAIYKTPYKNPPPEVGRQGYRLLSQKRVDYQMQITSAEDIDALFKMTPYYYKTSAEDQQRLSGLSRLTVQADFQILEYERL